MNKCIRLIDSLFFQQIVTAAVERNEREVKKNVRGIYKIYRIDTDNV